MIGSPRDAMTVVPDADEAAVAFGLVTTLLWQERELLDRLLFQLVVQELVITAGKTRWLQYSDAEVRDTRESLQNHEIARVAETDLLVHRYGLPPDASLSALADVAHEPWRGIFLDHRTAMRELEAEIERAAEQNTRLLRPLRDGTG